MAIKAGGKDIQQIMYGSKLILSVMRGTELIWGHQPDYELGISLPQLSSTTSLRAFVDANNPKNLKKIVVLNYLVQPKIITGNLSGLDVLFINIGEIQGNASGEDAFIATSKITMQNLGWIRGAGGHGGKGGRGGRGGRGATWWNSNTGQMISGTSGGIGGAGNSIVAKGIYFNAPRQAGVVGTAGELGEPDYANEGAYIGGTGGTGGTGGAGGDWGNTGDTGMTGMTGAKGGGTNGDAGGVGSAGSVGGLAGKAIVGLSFITFISGQGNHSGSIN